MGDRQPADSYDVAILGGGLAGLTLGIQLKQARPETSIFIAEKRKGPAPEAAFKVGESTVEVSVVPATLEAWSPPCIAVTGPRTSPS